ncbi:hypothetical protein [Haloferula rosea]|uniref:SLA1 homology domain-containing protein n=1 Tax=Haloferula rosea TaxID=490093 RepID=A0A934RBQ8_9BACT|nr:hypothetical protein [Haloferula rosea]MBK1827620.1 hypothetical protein [Haloferula rosea]
MNPTQSFLIALLMILFIGTANAESRTWRNKEGSGSFTGTYLGHDARHVTIRRQDGQVFTLNIDKLHETDQAWLTAKNPPKAEETPINPNAIFDTLCFGDNRKDVEAKLKASKVVETTLDETFFGRFGLNGTYRTKQQIGGLHCELYFDWSKAGNLEEISLQTQGLGSESYASRLQDNWTELADLLTTLHGKPLQAGKYPERNELQNDLFLASHIWRLDGGGSALLGTSMQSGKYLIVVRFTTASIEPVRVP